MKIRKSVIYDILIMALFFLLDRTITIDFTDAGTNLYVLASRVGAVGVMLVWNLLMLRRNRPYLWAGLPYIRVYPKFCVKSEV